MPKRREVTISSFPTRCPYCDEVVEYHDLQPGNNQIKCSRCQNIFIKIVEPFDETPSNDTGE